MAITDTSAAAPLGRPGRLLELSADDAWALAATRQIGRLAWAGDDGPHIVPVNLALHAPDALLVRTTAYSHLAREAPDRVVAVEVDDVDEAAHEGWSVVLRGRARRDDRSLDGPRPWATGPRTLVLRIDVTQVTGRRLVPPR